VEVDADKEERGPVCVEVPDESTEVDISANVGY